jgi:hypothetical protein
MAQLLPENLEQATIKTTATGDVASHGPLGDEGRHWASQLAASEVSGRGAAYWDGHDANQVASRWVSRLGAAR